MNMKIKIKQLEKLLKKAVSKFVSEKEASYFARLQVDTHLKKFPRTNPLEDAISDLKSWKERPKTKMVVEVEKPSALLLNFNGLAPSLKIKYIHDQLEKKSKKNGVCIIGIRNSHGIHVLNLWTDLLSERGLISLCFFNGGPEGVVPYKGTRGVFGTNPLSFSVPAGHSPAIADFATSEIPYFEIKQAKKYGKKLKKNVAVDNKGRMTRDAKKALDDSGTSNLLPLGGGFKGYSLVYLIEVLTGPFVRSPLSTEMTPSYVNEEHGGLLVAFDISSFTGLNKFKKSVSSMNETIRSQKPAIGEDTVLVPGDRGYGKMRLLLRKGEIKIQRKLVEDLENLAR